MKNKLYLIVTFLFCFNILSAQKINLADLESLVNIESIDEFDSYATDKGYEYSETANTEISKRVSYTYGRNSSLDFTDNKISATYWLSFYKYTSNHSDYSKSITYQTNYKEDYMIIKSELKANGYTLITNETWEGKLRLVYKKKSNICEIYIGTTISAWNNIVNYYEISLNRINGK